MYVGCLLSPGVDDAFVIHLLLVKQNICQYETCGRVEPAEIERIPYQVVENLKLKESLFSRTCCYPPKMLRVLREKKKLRVLQKICCTIQDELWALARL